MPAPGRFTRGPLVFDVCDEGPRDGTPVVLLHGFPQDSRCWDRVAPLLHEHGYRTLAPDQRGYSPGARPRPRSAYRRSELVADVAELVLALDAGPVHLVGHDWGALVAYGVAARHPELCRSLTSLSVPHPASFARSLVTSPQLLRSWYLLAFQLPVLPELVLGGSRLEGLLRETGAPCDVATRDAGAMRDRARARAALAWYRAIPFGGRGPGRIRVPTLHVWSDGDAAVGPWAARRNERYLAARYTYRVLRGVSHWIPDEAPEATAELLTDHFASV